MSLSYFATCLIDINLIDYETNNDGSKKFKKFNEGNKQCH